MRYWLLTTEYPPFFGGGISTYCFNTATMLSAQGYAVTVFINDHTAADYKIEKQDDVRLVRFNPSYTKEGSFLGHAASLGFEFAHVVQRFIREEGKPDIIEAQEYLGIAYYLLQFKLLRYEWCRDVPVLITMHSPAFLYLEYNHVPLYKYPNYWIGEMERFCIQAADLVVSPSRFLISQVELRFQYAHDRFKVIPNPFTVPENKYHSTSETQNQILFFGKLSAQKGISKLLQYFKELWDEGFVEPLYLIGGQDIVYHPEGSTMGELVKKQYKKYIRKGLLHLECQIPPNQVATRVSQAKVVIVPSTVDNLPYVVIEMMHLGLVVLVSKQGGQAEIVTDGITGFIFDHDIPGSFQGQLQKVLSLSDSEREVIGRAAKQSVMSNFRPDVIFPQKDNAIRLAIANKRNQRDFPFIRRGFNTSNGILNFEGIKEGMLSIVIPYYNMGSYIDETIASVKNSSVRLKEIIIVNDGSTESESIIKLEQYRLDPQCRVLDTPNQGLGGARNFGAKQASGQFLAFLDADDIVAPTYFSKAIEVLEFYQNVHFVGAWTKYFEGSSKIWPTFNPEPPIILYHNLVNSSALVYKRESFLRAGLNDTNMPFQGLEDYDSVLSLLEFGYWGVVLPEVLFHYRVRHNSMIRGVSNTKKMVLYEYLSQKHKTMYASYAVEVFSLANANGSGTGLDNPTLDYNLLDKFPFNHVLVKKTIQKIKRSGILKRLAVKIVNKVRK